MAATKKQIKQTRLNGRAPAIVVVVEREIASEDTLFPEKVAKAKKMLKRTKFHPSLGI